MLRVEPDRDAAARTTSAPPAPRASRERRILLRHALRISMITFVSLFGLDFGVLVGGGALLTEVVFGMQGVGKLTYDSLQNLDLPVIMATVMYAAFFIVVANALVDVALRLARPAGARCLTRRCSRSRTCACRSAPRTGSSARSTASPSRRAAARSLGIVGESGSGKSVTADERHAADPRSERRSSRARSLYKGRDLLDARRRATCAACAAREIAMIFQDPMTALDAGLHRRLADRRADARARADLQARGARARAIELLARGRHSRPRERASTTTRTSSPAACASAR